jgi:hypothetical protein
VVKPHIKQVIADAECCGPGNAARIYRSYR